MTESTDENNCDKHISQVAVMDRWGPTLTASITCLLITCDNFASSPEHYRHYLSHLSQTSASLKFGHFQH